MIPKYIHYCWFGGKEKDSLSLRCIESWKRIMPEYKLWEWNEDNFDINSNNFVREAFQEKQYAFVADYVRMYAIWKHGGIYLDCDVEVIKKFDEFLDLPAFTSYESNSNEDLKHIEAGILASEKSGAWISGALKLYENRSFKRADGKCDFTPLPRILADYTVRQYGNISGVQTDTLDDVTIFNCKYFSPKNSLTDEIRVEKETVCIHHFNNSWGAPYCKLRHNYIKKFGAFFGRLFFMICHPIKFMKVIKFKFRK